MPRIVELVGLEILDSRGRPTVKASCKFESGACGFSWTNPSRNATSGDTSQAPRRSAALGSASGRIVRMECTSCVNRPVVVFCRSDSVTQQRSGPAPFSYQSAASDVLPNPPGATIITWPRSTPRVIVRCSAGLRMYDGSSGLGANDVSSTVTIATPPESLY